MFRLAFRMKHGRPVYPGKYYTLSRNLSVEAH